MHNELSTRCEICGQLLVSENTEKITCTKQSIIPWENMEALGTFKALYQTVYHCLLKPSKIFCLVSNKSSLFYAWLFGLVVGSIGILLDLVWQNGSLNFLKDLSEYGISTNLSNMSGHSLIYSPLILTTHMFFLGLYVHTLLIITGGKHNTLRSTIITACYTQSAAVLSIIPFMSSFISVIWALCLLIIGTSCVHKISIARSSLTILLPVILMVIILSFITIAAVSGGIFMGTFFKEFLSIFR